MASTKKRAKRRTREPEPAAARPAKIERAKPRARRAATKKASAEALVREALAPHGFPTPPGPGLCFDPADDERFALGYPELRSLTEEHVEPEAAALAAESALDAIDPTFRLAVPRETARRFLLGYRVGPLLFVDADVPQPPENAARRDERSRLLRSDRAIDAALLEETLDVQCSGMGDTYGRWRIAKVLYLYEGFIGSEAVARTVVAFLAKQAARTDWPELLADPRRTNAAPHHVALALPWILRRVAPSVARTLRESLGALRDPDAVGDDEPGALFGLLRWLADPTAPPHPSIAPLADSLALCSDDAAAVSARLDRRPRDLLWIVGRAIWLLGTERLAGPLPVAGHDLVRMVDQVAPIRDPGVVRLIARVATQRAGRAAAQEWLRAHADHARPILASLSSLEDRNERDAAEAALGLLDSGDVAPAEVLSEEEAEREIAAIFAELGRTLEHAKDRPEQIELIRAAHERYTETRAAAGDPTPEAYFTHRFGELGLGRWAMLAVDAIR